MTEIFENFRDNELLRNNFFEFVNKIFPGLSFNQWYDKGYWTGKYIPHSLVKDNQIISNVSISKMKICMEGNFIQGIQFGTVGTLPEYRKQSMSKNLMDYVLDKYEESADLFFLFANDSVLNFYPKFGFEQKKEMVYILKSGIPKSNYKAVKLDIRNKFNFELIKGLLNNRLMLTEIFGSQNYQFITMWHILNVFPENIYYLKDENIIFIYTIENNQLKIWDILFAEPFNISLCLSNIIPHKINIKSICFYFPPDQIKFNYDEVLEDSDSLLFVKGNFPIKGKHFKFPTTAQT